jgi:uncharacterized protein
MSVRLEPHAEGVVLPVKANPGARENAIRGAHDGQLKVSVTAAPEKGKANKAIAETLASELQLKRAQIELIAGETAAQKRFLIRDCNAAELLEKIEQAMRA